MGLKLNSPVIAGSCGFTGSVDKLKEFQDAGAGAVVLKSIFEEQIMMEIDSAKAESIYLRDPGAHDYISHYTRYNSLRSYLTLIKEAKKALDIPVIASVNCMTSHEWVSFAKEIQEAGADAVELNMFIIPGDIKKTSSDYEKIYFDVVNNVRENLNIPLSLKLGFYFSGMAKFIFDLSVRDVDGLVMFNRFYRPDIDIEKIELTKGVVLSNKDELSLPLRWIGMMSDEVKCDLCATTGAYDSEGVIKYLLAGAKAVQVASVLYKEGAKAFTRINQGLNEWMDKRNFKNTSDFIGRLGQDKVVDPQFYERVQFMKFYSDVN